MERIILILHRVETPVLISRHNTNISTFFANLTRSKWPVINRGHDIQTLSRFKVTLAQESRPYIETPLYSYNSQRDLHLWNYQSTLHIWSIDYRIKASNFSISLKTIIILKIYKLKNSKILINSKPLYRSLSLQKE